MQHQNIYLCLQKDMFSLNESNRFVLSLTSVNMRNGINGLCGLILYTGLIPTNGDVYIFINRNRTILKLLHWERGGYVVYHKRLEEGRISHKVFLKEGVGFKSLRWDELVLLLEGINPNTRRRKRYNSREIRS